VPSFARLVGFVALSNENTCVSLSHPVHVIPQGCLDARILEEAIDLLTSVIRGGDAMACKMWCLSEFGQLIVTG
jgi:hypothetical protein